MAGDLYSILGVTKTASADEVRAAYRKLAKTYHPDLNPGDAQAEDRFKAVQGAFDILGDADKRKRYDAGEIDETGAERAPRGFYRDYAGPGGPGFRYGRAGGAGAGAGRPGGGRAGAGMGADDLGDIFSEIFGRRRQAAGGDPFAFRGQDVKYAVTVDFIDAAKGAKKRMTMPDGRTLEVGVPAGLRDGQVLRLKGQGQPGIGGAEAGDALVTVSVAPHPVFRREGDDVHMELSVSLGEVVLGGSVSVPTIDGPVSLNVPAGSNSGRLLRLKGKGIKGGNQIVRLRVMLPEVPDDELVAFVKKWAPKHPYDPRK